MENVFQSLTILDHTRYLLGGYATQFFADMGAKVIKIEEITAGDFCREEEPMINGVSHYFAALNRNKKSVTLNFKSEKGRDAYFRLVEQADVVIENFRPGVMDRLGIGYEAEKKVNPKIIHCSMSSFGKDDPRSLKALHDINFQALSGYLSLNGSRITPIHMVDVSTGMVAIQSVMSALLQRSHTGKGAYCDVRMFDSFVWWNSLIDSRFHFFGGRIDPDTLDYPALAYNIYETKDGGYVSIGMLEEKFWGNFLAALGREDLTLYKLCHRQDAPEAYEALEAEFKNRTLQEWKDFFADKDICAMPVLSKAEAIDYIVGSGTGLMEYVDFPTTGKILQTRIPHQVSSIPVSLADAAEPPGLGQHNVDILQGIGFSRQELEEMAREGACGSLG